MHKKAVSIYTIAEEAGVSPSTVSRVLTGSARVRGDKKERIQSLIEKYNFKPNALARGLINVETKVIGVMVSDIRNPFYARIFVECEKAAYEKGYMLILCNSLGSNDRELSHLEKLVSQRVDAIIQIGGKVDELVSDPSYVEHVNRIANSIPLLITGKLDGADCYQVNIDEGRSMELLLEYLIGLGHEEIALMGGRNDVKSTIEKRFRYRQLLQRHHIDVKEEYIVDSDSYDTEGGYSCMKKFLDLEIPPPTAIIAINDFTCMGIMRSLKVKGLRVPEDVSLVSFDNTYIAETSLPRLTSVGHDYHQFGEALIETAVRAIRHENPQRMTYVGSELIVRESSRRFTGTLS